MWRVMSGEELDVLRVLRSRGETTDVSRGAHVVRFLRDRELGARGTGAARQVVDQGPVRDWPRGARRRVYAWHRERAREDYERRVRGELWYVDRRVGRAENGSRAREDHERRVRGELERIDRRVGRAESGSYWARRVVERLEGRAHLRIEIAAGGERRVELLVTDPRVYGEFRYPAAAKRRIDEHRRERESDDDDDDAFCDACAVPREECAYRRGEEWKDYLVANVDRTCRRCGEVACKCHAEECDAI